MDGRLNKILDRLRVALDESKFYEAHQLYKTIYFRCIARGAYTEACEHMLLGARCLLEHKQWESGTDVAKLYLKALDKGNVELTSQLISDLRYLHKLMSPGSIERSTFVSIAYDLLKKSGTEALLASFSEYLGRNLWYERNFSEARYHLMNSEDGFATGCLLIEFHMCAGYGGEIDLFIAQAVLQCLCMEKASMASVSYYTYTRRHPQLEEPGPPFLSFPLLNFLWFLMLAIKEKCGIAVYTVLCEKYQGTLSRDPCYRKYLDKIGQVYFGLPPPSEPQNDFFTNVMSLFSGNSSDTPDSVANGAMGGAFGNSFRAEDMD